jgi:hypothetical protein
MARSNECFRLRPATNADGPAIQSLVFAVLGEYRLSPVIVWIVAFSSGEAAMAHDESDSVGTAAVSPKWSSM